jgi:hypothetical protein
MAALAEHLKYHLQCYERWLAMHELARDARAGALPDPSCQLDRR